MNDSKITIPEIRLNGIPASPGIAIGTALVIGNRISTVDRRDILPSEIDSEFSLLDDAIELTKKQITALQEKVNAELNDQDAKIFDAHILLLDDYTLISSVKEEIKRELISADYAFFCKIQSYIKIINKINDPYIKERSADIMDVASRIVLNIYGKEFEEIKNLPGQRIIISSELSPSDTVTMDRENVQAFATETGSRTSHATIIARSMKIPAVVGVKPNLSQIHTGDIIIVDGYKGVVIINPSIDSLNFYAQKEIIGGKLLVELMEESDLKSETLDSHKVQISANIELLEDIKEAEANKAAGIGLYRTEYLYISRNSLPSEQIQFETYKQAAQSLHGKHLIIRTLDLGGDKMKPNLNSYSEKNPFLGFRAIRYCLAYPELFKTQLRAILRASVYGDVKVMFPMISCLEEVTKALQYLNEVKAELTRKEIPFNNNIDVGIMIETPSAALMADKLAEKVKFFSLGTNDLVQYTMVVDRNSEKVAYLYQPSHPSVLTLIKMVVEAARRKGIWVGICGEMASDPQYTILLLGLGINELSMSPGSINIIRKIIRNAKMHEAERIVQCALNSSTADEALSYSLEYLKTIVPDIYNIVIKGS
ncbi:MAG TPA: phosphoenolpyruvate--protein phosphotransferase [Lentisphaeria bacterium]|nr:MAG: phosphoenolpyruvate--protein phosphotransferase [Lentisphaerae bacterium GWF2_38_69]HBM16222.1 phosphoenolpyruvate--protein phosphotransferase [Lentisphaeria bacterium]